MKAQDYIKNISPTDGGRIIVIGDYMNDVYIEVEKVGVNPENHHQFYYKKVKTFNRPGGAGNVLSNLTSLGAPAYNLPFANPKEEYLPDRILPRFFFPSKIRYVTPNGEVLFRVDENDECSPCTPANIASYLEDHTIDAIVVVDYGKGSVNFPEMGDYLRSISRKNKIMLYINSKNPIEEFPKNATYFCNHSEYERSKDFFDSCSHVVITNTNKNVVYQKGPSDYAREPLRMSFPVVAPKWAPNIKSVCGAGDTFMAAYIWSEEYVGPDTFEDSIRIAIAASQAVIRKPHTNVVVPDEVIKYLEAYDNEATS